MIPAIPTLLPMPFAQNGEKRAIPEENTDPGSANASWATGFPPITRINKQAGGKPPYGLDFQGIFNALSQHLYFLQSGGIYPWMGASDDFPGLNYLKGAHVMGNDGEIYIALKPSGPEIPASSGGFIGPVDPVGDTNGFWRNENEPKYELCEFYLHRHPDPAAGMVPLDGSVIENAANIYPEAWAKLQTSWGQKLCKTESEWQELSTKTYYTLADGTKVGFNGIGGVGYYSLNTATGSIRMPDIRGQFFGAAGAGSLNVPGVSLIDSIREIAGHWGNAASNVAGIHAISTGACLWYINGATNRDIFELVNIGSANPGIKASRVHPVSESVRPKSIGMLACAWMGVPAN